MTSQSSNPINPDYYKRDGLEAIDVIEAFFMHSPHLATAFKYLARMGEKPGNSLEQDAEKAKWYIDRWVQFKSTRADDGRLQRMAIAEELQRISTLKDSE